jgi:hypothetical protein
MFDRICFRSTNFSGEGRLFDLGALAEALIFYGRTHLVLNYSGLRDLIHSLGPQLLLRLAQTEGVSLGYCNPFTGIKTENTGTNHERYSFTVAQLPDHQIDVILHNEFDEVLGEGGRSRRMAHRFLNVVQRLDLDQGLAYQAEQAAAEESVFLEESANLVLAYLAPGYIPPDPLKFGLIQLDEHEWQVDSNIDFGAAQANARRETYPNAQITPAALLSFVTAAEEDLAFAALFGSEIEIPYIRSQVLRIRQANLIKRVESSREERANFQSFVFDDARSIREAVNSGRVDFAKVLEVVEKSRHFREWLDGQLENVDLAREYFRACTDSTWIDDLPGKALRWVLVNAASTGAGVVLTGPPGFVVGTAIATVDLLVDLLREGWKPNHFVQDDLKPLINPH